jgi:hypothetical protein
MPKKTQRMVYAKGKSVFELIDPDGHIYVLHAHDAQFPIESLAKLGEQMKQLPKGWQYRTRALTEDLVLAKTWCWTSDPTKRSMPSMMGGVFCKADRQHKDKLVNRAKILDSSTRALLGIAKAMLSARGNGTDPLGFGRRSNASG